ncbi:MAG TPA: hypothetical protein VE988_16825, partial [Gemmataceae bacterium]|nr:hypothetical protein [Gemmataceae bacterium]
LWPADASQPTGAFDAKMLDIFVARNIGPANMGGRIVDIAGVDSDPKTVYVATASGGLWKTTDGGDNWKPIFDHQSSVCIGDVAVSQSNPNIVWVGTGEHNPRNSVAWGDGIYKSTDGGKSWTHMGLRDSHSIGRIAIHPTNPDIVYVGVLGHLWGPNKERGIFKTTDGGKTWETSFFLDENTGIVDLQMDPTEPNVLYAAAYCCRRDGFSGGNPKTQYGPKAGLYKTADGGKTWVKMTEGLPTTTYGRCGFDIYRKNTNVVYAVVQTNSTKTDTTGNPPNGTGGANGGGIFRSDDKGKTWKFLNTLCPRPFYYGQVRVDPNDDRRIYCLGVQFFKSDDGGKQFSSTMAGHSDNHALWVNPQNSNEVWLGTDGGFYKSTNKAGSFTAIRAMALAQYYGISVDMSKPYYVYGGLQDNGSHGGPSATYTTGGIRQNEWFNIGGGDGFHTQCDPTDPNTVYSESQYGKPQRVNVAGMGASKGGMGGMGGGKGGGGGKISPPSGRYNWSAPMLLSPHDPKTLYYGGNVLLKSTERGANLKAISPDLSYGGKGQAHTLFTISESPVKKGVLWTGSDDGRIMVSKDSGGKWDDVSKIPNMPKDSCISRVEASYHAEGTCYVSITRYRNDDRKPYVFKTTNFGESWENITSNLPESGSVHVVIESSKNKNLLFCGTEFGLFVSVEGGKVWHRMTGGLPTVAVHDLVIHPRDRDLVIGTHGRGIYIMDDISPLEAMTPETLKKPVLLFDTRPAVAFKWKQAAAVKSNVFVGQNPPYGSIIRYHLTYKNPMPANIGIVDKDGKKIATIPCSNDAGLHQVVWDLRADGQKEGTVAPGEYTLMVDVGPMRQTQKIRVEAEK